MLFEVGDTPAVAEQLMAGYCLKYRAHLRTEQEGADCCFRYEGKDLLLVAWSKLRLLELS